jgi:hypothetical protein
MGKGQWAMVNSQWAIIREKKYSIFNVQYSMIREKRILNGLSIPP